MDSIKEATLKVEKAKAQQVVEEELKVEKIIEPINEPVINEEKTIFDYLKDNKVKIS